MDLFISTADPVGGDSSSSSNLKMNLSQTSELDVHQIAAELEHMNMYLNDLELRLGTGVPACPRPQQCEDVPQLVNSRNPLILKLQRNAHKLQRQIGQLIKCSAQARNLLDELERGHCSVWQMRANVEQMCNAMDSVHREMDRDANICLQRYNFLCRSRANWAETNIMANEMKIVFDRFVVGMVTKSTYRVERQNIFKQLEDVESVCAGATDELKREAKDIATFLDALFDLQILDSIISIDKKKRTLLELDQKRLQYLLQRQPFVSFSREWHERMLKFIQQTF